MTSNPARTYVITGASSGIGAQFARSLAAKGYHLILVARRMDRLEELAKELTGAFGVTVTCLDSDLSQRDHVIHLLKRIKDLDIHVDGLVNNAGYSIAQTFASTTWAQQSDFVDVCVTTPTHLAHGLLAPMLERGFGRIINISSIVAFSPGASGHTLYPAAKAYMLKFSRSLAAEVAAKGVKVTAVCPGTTDSEFMQANGMTKVLPQAAHRRGSMSAEEVVDIALRANEQGREVVVTGLINKFAVVMMGLLPDPLVTGLIRWGASKYQIQD